MTGINGLIVTKNPSFCQNRISQIVPKKLSTTADGDKRIDCDKKSDFLQNRISQTVPKKLSTTADGDKRIDCAKKSDFLPKSDFSNRAQEIEYNG
jgi:hypothetical protein